ncbi:MAG: hypothetical protein AABW73_02005 [Nanoarchaeota archaeon]
MVYETRRDFEKSLLNVGRIQAGTLVGTLQQRIGLIVPDEELVTNLSIESTPKGEQFSKNLGYNDSTIIIPNSENYVILSLGSLLNNEKQAHEQPSLLEIALNRAITLRTGINLDRLVEKLREEREILELMNKDAQTAYSLLGLAKTMEVERNGAAYSATRPILAIPGIGSNERVSDWERKNTVYRREGSFSSTIISEEEYKKAA